jgi:hypothetical protein
MPIHALRVALAGFVDYAGLFPPAGLDLAAVVANAERYARSPERWFLGRLVVPAGKLHECAALVDAGAPPDRARGWTVSVLVQPGDALDLVAPAVKAFDGRMAGRGVQVVSVEAAAGTAADVEAIAALPATLERYVEVALDAGLEGMLDRIASRGCAAKVRTGGLTADRIPSPGDLARCVVACRDREVPFKATAGLHHPLRASHPLTYEPASPCATMHGFVNLLAAAALLHARRIDASDVAHVLSETEASAFAPEADQLRWRDKGVSTDELRACRTHLLRSVGSCSFEEPLCDLRALGWLPR